LVDKKSAGEEDVQDDRAEQIRKLFDPITKRLRIQPTDLFRLPTSELVRQMKAERPTMPIDTKKIVEVLTTYFEGTRED
jgi:hypothetical protein